MNANTKQLAAQDLRDLEGLTPELIATWCASGADEIASSPGPGVQSAAEIQADMDNRVPQLHGLADRIYSRWIQGLRK